MCVNRKTAATKNFTEVSWQYGHESLDIFRASSHVRFTGVVHFGNFYFLRRKKKVRKNFSRRSSEATNYKESRFGTSKSLRGAAKFTLVGLSLLKTRIFGSGCKIFRAINVENSGSLLRDGLFLPMSSKSSSEFFPHGNIIYFDQDPGLIFIICNSTTNMHETGNKLTNCCCIT